MYTFPESSLSKDSKKNSFITNIQGGTIIIQGETNKKTM